MSGPSTSSHPGANNAFGVLTKPFKKIVSQNRRRFKQDGFDLDLTSRNRNHFADITDRIIAMGYPSPENTTEVIYRNSMEHTRDFLEKRHPGHYMVFNLRGRYVYDVEKFHGRVVSFEMDDHHPPRLELMAPFCRQVHEWLESDERNVVAVHCKAGKGRTGVMICAYLVYINFYPSPRQCMDYYSCIRTHNNKGVTIPSQRRYVFYYSHLRKTGLNYFPLRMQLVGIYIERPPKVSGVVSNGGIHVRVRNGDVDVFTGEPIWLPTEELEADDAYWKTASAVGYSSNMYTSRRGTVSATFSGPISPRCYGWTIAETQPVFLEGDVRLDLYQKTTILKVTTQEKVKIGHIWFNTMFCCSGFCSRRYNHGEETPNAAGQSSPSLPTSPSPIDGMNGSSGQKVIAPSALSAHKLPSDPGVPFESIYPPPGLLKHSSNPTAIYGDNRKDWPQEYIADILNDARAKTAAQRQQRECKESEHSTSTARGTTASSTKTTEPTIATPSVSGLSTSAPTADLSSTSSHRSSMEGGPKSAPPTACSPRERGGPFSVMFATMQQPLETLSLATFRLDRGPGEHLALFSQAEVDKAFKKSKNLAQDFKVYIVTKCIDRRDPAMTSSAEEYVNRTLLAQEAFDRKRRESVSRRQRRIDKGSSASASNVSDSMDSTDSCSTYNGHATSSMPSTAGLVFVAGRKASNDSDNRWEDDPRFADHRYQKYFFRQRADSHSTYPPVDYKCPMRRGMGGLHQFRRDQSLGGQSSCLGDSIDGGGPNSESMSTVRLSVSGGSVSGNADQPVNWEDFGEEMPDGPVLEIVEDSVPRDGSLSDCSTTSDNSSVGTDDDDPQASSLTDKLKL